jgi:predicted MFS family arabinose efflux permease
MCIPMGRLVDRFGARRIAIGSLAAHALGFALLGLLTAGLTSFLILTGVMALLGAGSSPLPFTRLIVARFRQRQGLALGFAMVGTGLGATLIPAVLPSLIAGHGWRLGYLALAGYALGGCVLVAALLRGFDTQPVRIGDEPILAIVRDPAFVRIAVPIFLASTAILGVVVHLVPMLTDAGLGPVRAGQYAALVGVTAIVGRRAIGAVLDRVAPAWVAATLFAVAALGVCLVTINPRAMGALSAMMLGLAVGGEGNLVAVLVARHFEMSHYGRAYGTLYTLFLLGGAVGPALIGFLFDAFGGYFIPMSGAALVLTAACAACVRIPRTGAGYGQEEPPIGFPRKSRYEQARTGRDRSPAR